MGRRLTVALILVLAILPIWERMRGWKLRIRHPDPRYLNTAEYFYRTDDRPHVYLFDYSGTKKSVQITGKGAWRPDPDAQVDEIRAKLAEDARK